MRKPNFEPETHQIKIPYNPQNIVERRYLHNVLNELPPHVTLTPLPKIQHMQITWLNVDMKRTKRFQLVDHLLRPYSEFLQTCYKNPRLHHDVQGFCTLTNKKDNHFAVFANGFITSQTKTYLRLFLTKENRIIAPGDHFTVYFSPEAPDIRVTPITPTPEAKHDDATVMVMLLSGDHQNETTELVLDALHWS